MCVLPFLLEVLSCSFFLILLLPFPLLFFFFFPFPCQTLDTPPPPSHHSFHPRRGVRLGFHTPNRAWQTPAGTLAARQAKPHSWRWLSVPLVPSNKKMNHYLLILSNKNWAHSWGKMGKCAVCDERHPQKQRAC